MAKIKGYEEDRIINSNFDHKENFQICIYKIN